MAKGEMQFTTIALLVITAIVLVAVIIWFLPTFSESSGDLAGLGEEAGATAEEVVEAKCEAWCISGSETDFCEADSGCSTYVCSEITCPTA
jgi:hypothetical protein